jgi:HEAT repeat protein
MRILPVLLFGAAMFASESAPAQGVLYRGPGELESSKRVAPGTEWPPARRGPDHSIPEGPNLYVWEFWWEFNSTGLLADIRAKHRAEGAMRSPSEWARVAPELSSFWDQVVPELHRALGAEQPADFTASALIALAKIGQQPDSKKLEPFFLGYLNDKRGGVAESAVIALGILGQDTSVKPIVELLMNSATGHRITGTTSVPGRLRSFAAMSLGLIGSRTGGKGTRLWIYDSLLATFLADASNSRDLGVACLLAIGQVPLESKVACGKQVDQLMSILGTPSIAGDVRCHAASSAAKLLGGLADAAATDAALATLVDMFTAKLEGRGGDYYEHLSNMVVRRSCVLAMGELVDLSGSSVDRAARSILLAAEKDQTDTHVRSFCLIAMGQIASRRVGEGQTGAQAQLLEGLALTATEGRHIMREWAGVGLGIALHGMGEAAPASALEMLGKKLVADRGPWIAGQAVAAGLSGHDDFQKILQAKFETFHNEMALGYLALGMGMLGGSDAQAALAKGFGEATGRPVLQMHLATAIALDPMESSLGALLEVLEVAESDSLRAALAIAIGSMDDRRALAPLLELATSDTLDGAIRASAVQALGILGSQSNLSWHAPLTTGFNYRETTASLTSTEEVGLFRYL